MKDTYSYIRLLKALSSLTLNVSRNGASSSTLGNLCQCLTIIVKNFLFIYDLNLPSFSLKPFPFVLSQQTLLKSLSFLTAPLQILKGHYQVTSKPSLLQTEQPQLPQPVLAG